MAILPSVCRVASLASLGDERVAFLLFVFVFFGSGVPCFLFVGFLDSDESLDSPVLLMFLIMDWSVGGQTPNFPPYLRGTCFGFLVFESALLVFFQKAWWY